MAYTFIVLNTDRTDKGSKTFTVPKLALYLMMALVLFAPSVTYYIAYYIVAPNYLVKEAKIYKEELDTLREQHALLEAKAESLEINNGVLKAEGITAREQLSEITTRIEIAEQARSTTSDRVQELEEEKLDLERRLAFYEKFVTPEVDEEILQCFNISIRQEGKKLKYGINFLKKDQKDQTRLETTVKLKVLYGGSILNLNEDSSIGSDRQVSMSITKDRRLTGSLSAEIPNDGLHILDVKAYTKDNKVIILRQYRFAVSRYLLEFPAGTLEIGETPINSIQREIQEETGFSANKWDELGTLVPAPGYADEEIYLFLARDLNKLNSEVKGDLDEDIEVLILDPDELDNLISSGDEILDAKTVTAWFRAKQFLDKL